MAIPPATIVGLIGHNGAGKTTLFDVLTGFLRADGGAVLLDGDDITDLPPHRRAIAELGRSFQEARLFPSLTVADALRVALETHLANREPVAAALRLPASTLSERSATRRVEQLIGLLGLEPYRDRPTGDLSTGTRRIVELGCLLAQDPAVVLLDEPSAGIAQRETEALGPMLRDVQAETGCSLVVIEHDMNLLSGLCDQFVALEQGTVIAAGPPAAVLADHRVISSYLGTNEDVIHRSGEQHQRQPAAPVSYYPGEPDRDRYASGWSRPEWEEPQAPPPPRPRPRPRPAPAQQWPPPPPPPPSSPPPPSRDPAWRPSPSRRDWADDPWPPEDEPPPGRW
jgi:ABC-type branched-subunit amino acid transport system ATPase component